MLPDRHLNKAIIIALLICGVLLWITGCGKRQQATYSNGRIVQGYELPYSTAPGVFRGDPTYAVVNTSALPAINDDFRNVLFGQGLVKWDPKFDCNHFAALYIGLAQARWASVAFQNDQAATTLALAEFWYRPASGGAHAIVLALTEQGPRFIEPQTGQLVTLTPAEIASAFLVKW